MTCLTARLPRTFGIRQFMPTRSPTAFLYSPIGFDEAPMYLPCEGTTIPANSDSRQNWYTVSVDCPQFASITHLSTRIAAPSSRTYSRPRISPVSFFSPS